MEVPPASSWLLRMFSRERSPLQLGSPLCVMLTKPGQDLYIPSSLQNSLVLVWFFFFLDSKDHRVFNLCSKPGLAGLEMGGVGCSDSLEPPLSHICRCCFSHIMGMQHRLIKNEITTWTSFFSCSKANVFIQTMSGIQCLCLFWDLTLLSFKQRWRKLLL